MALHTHAPPRREGTRAKHGDTDTNGVR
eukprot:SAG22_NODE_17243_length_309_cov_0.300000_1_plen_27_part_10